MNKIEDSASNKKDSAGGKIRTFDAKQSLEMEMKRRHLRILDGDEVLFDVIQTENCLFIAQKFLEELIKEQEKARRSSHLFMKIMKGDSK